MAESSSVSESQCEKRMEGLEEALEKSSSYHRGVSNEQNVKITSLSSKMSYVLGGVAASSFFVLSLFAIASYHANFRFASLENKFEDAGKKIDEIDKYIRYRNQVAKTKNE